MKNASSMLCSKCRKEIDRKKEEILKVFTVSYKFRNRTIRFCKAVENRTIFLVARSKTEAVKQAMMFDSIESSKDYSKANSYGSCYHRNWDGSNQYSSSEPYDFEVSGPTLIVATDRFKSQFDNLLDWDDLKKLKREEEKRRRKELEEYRKLTRKERRRKFLEEKTSGFHHISGETVRELGCKWLKQYLKINTVTNYLDNEARRMLGRPEVPLQLGNSGGSGNYSGFDNINIGLWGGG